MTAAAESAVLDRPHLLLEAGKVAELGRALGAVPGTLPPTYTVLAAHSTLPGRSPNELVIAAAGLDPARVLLGAMEWVHHRQPGTGTTLQGTVRLVETATKRSRQSGTLRIAIGRVVWEDDEGAVAEVRSTLLEPAKTPAAPATRLVGSAAEAQPTGEQLTLTRTDIVRYAGASGDFNPVHHDHEAARALGYPDVFAMGLLPGGILAARLAASSGLAGRQLSLSFRGIVWPGTPYAVDIAGDTATLCGPEGHPLVQATLRPVAGTEPEVTR